MSHQTSRLTMLMLAIASIVVGGWALFAVPSTQAETEVYTQTLQNVTETFSDTVPCLGGKATVTITYNSVFHVTQLDDGTYHLTGTQTGDFVIVPDGRNQPTYTGHFTVWFGENGNKKSFNGTFTFSIQGKGSDGSSLSFHENAHFSVSASGATVEFDKLRCA